MYTRHKPVKCWIFLFAAVVIAVGYFLEHDQKPIDCHFLCSCMDVIPEAVKVTYRNDKYFKSLFMNIRRYGRNSSYYANVWGETVVTMGNNMTSNIILTEYLHNEYRRSFIEFHYKFCDLINKEPYIGGALKKSGLVCPMPPGNHNLMNMTAQTQDFPNVFPFEKGGVDFNFVNTETGEVAMSGFFHVKFRQKKRNN